LLWAFLRPLAESLTALCRPVCPVRPWLLSERIQCMNYTVS